MRSALLAAFVLTACAAEKPARREAEPAAAAAPTAAPAGLGPVCAELAACCAKVKPPDREACDYTVGLRDETYCVPTLETYRSYCR